MKFSDLVIIQGSRAQVRMKFSVVSEVSTFLIITQVSSSWKKSHVLIFSKCKYLHAKIGSLGTIKSCLTIGPIL